MAEIKIVRRMRVFVSSAFIDEMHLHGRYEFNSAKFKSERARTAPRMPLDKECKLI